MPDSGPRYFLNGTMINMDQCDHTSCCTLDICPLDYAFINHIPSLGGTAFFVALFSLFLVLHILLGGYYRTWYFSISILCGLILEVLGYAGRLMMRSNPFNFSAFLLYLIPLTIGPAFMCAAIYVCLGRIVVVYGQHLSKLKPSTYTFLFVSSDFLSLLLQAAGGAVTSIAPDDNPSLRQSGINIMLAGLSLQVVSLVVFIILCGDFARRVLGQRGTGWDGEHRDVWGSRRFSFFLLALAIATITILVRSAFRVAELSQGFDGSLANDEVTFLVLEGTMVGIATIALTIGHPGYAFLGQWSRLTFAWSKKGEKSLPRKSVTSVDSQGETVERK